MLSDRHYMRPDSRQGGAGGRHKTSVTIVLMTTLVVAFALQQMDIAYGRSEHVRWLMLYAPDLARGYLWELITYQFLHGGLTHLAFNLVGLWYLGQYVEAKLGTFRYLIAYFVSGAAGGLLQSILGLIFPSSLFGVVPTVGASAGICGLLAAFCELEPEAFIRVMFIIPVKARHLLYISTGIALFFTLVPTDAGVAHAAHLGGILFGVFYVRRGLGLIEKVVILRLARSRERESRKSAPDRLSAISAQRTSNNEPAELPPREYMSQEVDPILDKISAHGIQSLTERERQILQAARNRMSKR